MLALLKKECLVNRHILIINLLIMLIFSPVFVTANSMPIFSGIIFSCFQPILTEVSGGKVNNDILVNSLPVTRWKVVGSKYLFSLINGMVILSVVSLVDFFLPRAQLITLKDFILGLTIVCIYLAVFFPMKYSVEKNFFFISFIGFMLILLAVIFPIINFGNTYDYWGMQDIYARLSILQVLAISSFSSFITLTISFRYANRVYNNRDIN